MAITNATEFNISLFNKISDSCAESPGLIDRFLSPLTYQRRLNQSSLLPHHTGETSASEIPILCFLVYKELFFDVVYFTVRFAFCLLYHLKSAVLDVRDLNDMIFAIWFITAEQIFEP